MSPQKKIILFDGVCNLCNGSVQFIIRHDKRGNFLFASLQSSYGQQQLIRHGFQQALGTIILIENGQVFQRSDAVLEIARGLSGAWPVFYAFKIFPRFIRDAAYNWVAKNRYRFFGKRDACMIPTPELRARFID